jgi:hypothetical protein
MADIAKLNVKVVADADALSAGLAKAEGRMGKFGQRANAVGGAVRAIDLSSPLNAVNGLVGSLGEMPGVAGIAAGAIGALAGTVALVMKLADALTDKVAKRANEAFERILAGGTNAQRELDRVAREALTENLQEQFQNLNAWWLQGLNPQEQQQIGAVVDVGQAVQRMQQQRAALQALLDNPQFAQLRQTAATQDAVQAAGSQVRALQLQAETFGMAADEAQRYRMVQDLVAASGLSVAEAQAALAGQLEDLAAAQERLARLQQQQEAVRAGQQLAQQLRTPLEVYQDRLRELEGLLGRGAINFETYARAALDAEEALLRAGDAQQALAGPAALREGSSAALQAVNRIRRAETQTSRQDRLARVAEQQRELAQRQLRESERLRQELVAGRVFRAFTFGG